MRILALGIRLTLPPVSADCRFRSWSTRPRSGRRFRSVRCLRKRCRIHERTDLFRFQFPNLAGLQSAQCQLSNADPPNFLHENPDAFEHPVDLPVPPAYQRDLVPRAFAVPQEPHDLRLHSPPVNGESVAKPFETGLGRLPAELDLVHLGNLVLGSQDVVREFTIVRQEQEPFRVVVEAPDREQAPRRLGTQQVHDCGPSFRIAGGSDAALGLVQS